MMGAFPAHFEDLVVIGFSRGWLGTGINASDGNAQISRHEDFLKQLHLIWYFCVQVFFKALL